MPLALIDITPPTIHRGREQLPVTGHSFASVLGHADAPATNRLQYFEQFGSRALVAEQDGRWWKAVAKHNHGDTTPEIEIRQKLSVNGLDGISKVDRS